MEPLEAACWIFTAFCVGILVGVRRGRVQGWEMCEIWMTYIHEQEKCKSCSF